MSDLNIWDTSPKLLIAAAVIVIAYCIRRFYSSVSQLPPGPFGLPILGRLPWLCGQHFEESLHEMAKRNQEVFSFKAGQRLMVVLSSAEVMREMLKDEKFAGRLVAPQAAEAAAGCGIVFTEGQTWSEQRRVCLRVMRNFGFAKSQSVEVIHEEITRILGKLDQNRTEVETNNLFSLLSNGAVANLLFGRRYGDDQKLVDFVANLQIMLQYNIAAGLTLMFPLLTPLLRRLSKAKRASIAAEKMKNFIEGEIRQREINLTDFDTEPECVADAYIQERHKAEAKGDFETFKAYHLVRVGLEMFIAGTDTTAKSMQWLLLHMTQNPTVQAKVQSEVDSIVGGERRPQMSDRENLHFTQAVIDESMRMASLAFSSVPHRAVADTKFRGFLIPDDALIVPFLFGAHRDPSVWSKPNEFYPEHFLDSSGNYKSSKFLIPFGVGKRACPGESLGKLEIFHAFTAIMQRYTVKLSKCCIGKEAEIMRGYTGAVRSAGHHLLDFVPRHE